MTALAVFTNVGSKKEARQLANAMVEARLAACAQISKIDSVYAWKGKIERGKEYRVLFKTTEARYEQIEHAIRSLHSYELPAIHALAFDHISAPYAGWIEETPEPLAQPPLRMLYWGLIRQARLVE